MTTAIKRQTDGTIDLLMTIPWAEVEKLNQEVTEKTLAEIELPGFRKGKAPREMVLPKLDKTKLYEDVLQLLIPKVYNEAVTENKLHPIVTPKVELKEATEKKDWVVRALTCERPTIELGDYKKAITELNNSKKNKIWVPGQGETGQATPAKQANQASPGAQNTLKPTLDELLKTLFENAKVDLPKLLVDHEVNRLLAELIDETKKLGLSVEQYLASTGRTSDSVRKEYEEQAKRTLILEFALEDIADKEGILVSDDDIDAVVKSAKTDAEREALAKEKYYLASVLRRQKTLDFLTSLY